MSQQTQDRLPRGRHTLSRADVTARQRARMLRAMTQVVTERGYVDTPVAAVIERAGVSRETFYQQFTSKEDCFMSALETVVDVIFAATLGADDYEGEPFERFDRGLREYLDTLAANPGFARMFLIEVYAAGPEAIARRTALQTRYAERIVEIFGASGTDERFAIEALVHAISSLVTARLADVDVEGVRALHGPIMDLARRLEP
jgi:AcrR family transcriptional regulator